MTIPPKIKIALVVLIILAGSAFMAFAYFFNRATLEITSIPPFSVSIINQRSQSCDANPCRITLAPGVYQAEISKDGYQTAKMPVDLKLFQTLSISPNLTILPKVVLVAPWNPEKLFSDSPTWLQKLQKLSLATNSTTWTLIANQLNKIPSITFLDINSSGSWLIAENDNAASAIPIDSEKYQPISLTPNINYYFAPNSDTVYFIADNPENNLPSLFRKNLDSSAEPEQLINFLRTIPNPRLIINADQSQVALIERPNDKSSSLYLIDLHAKTRKIINQDELISDFIWLPTNAPDQGLISDQSVSPDNSRSSNQKTDSFLVEKINSETLLPNIYLASAGTPETQSLLPISNHLSALTSLSSNHLIITESFPDSTSGFNLLDFDLASQQSQTIFQVPDLSIPQKIEYSSSQHALYFLSDSTVYSLAPIL